VQRTDAGDALKGRLIALNDEERAQASNVLKSDRNHRHRGAMRKLDEEKVERRCRREERFKILKSRLPERESSRLERWVMGDG